MGPFARRKIGRHCAHIASRKGFTVSAPRLKTTLLQRVRVIATMPGTGGLQPDMGDDGRRLLVLPRAHVAKNRGPFGGIVLDACGKDV